MSPTVPVSILVPAYNAERYIAACLESVAAQTFGDFEAIIINDESTDGTADIARRFCARDPRFRLVDIPHSGLATARNRSLEAAKGEFICFLDADDTLRRDALELMILCQRSSGASIVACDFVESTDNPFTESTAPLQDTPERLPMNRKKILAELRQMTPEDAIGQTLYQKLLLNSVCGKIISRQHLPAGIFTDGIYYEDLDSFYRIFDKAEKIAYLPVALYFYRQVSTSMLHKWDSRRLDVLDVTDRILEYMHQHHPELVAGAEDRRFSAHFNMLTLMIINDIHNPAAIDRCLRVIREYRFRELRNPRVRLKNKLGALLSYGGLPLIRLTSRIISRQ